MSKKSPELDSANAALIASLPHPTQAQSLKPMPTSHREPGGVPAPKFEFADWILLSPHQTTSTIVAGVIGQEFMDLLTSDDAEATPYLERERLIAAKLLTVSVQLGQASNEPPFYVPPESELVEAELTNALASGDPIQFLDARITSLS